MITINDLWFANLFTDQQAPESWLKELAACAERALRENPERANPKLCDVGAKIVGPVVFGAGCIVGHGALIVGPAIFGDNCIIGHASEVTRSIFGNNAHAPHFNYVGDSVIGSNVNLGAGAKLANVRFDHQPPRGQDQEKCGAILGDGVHIGCNAVLDPGVIISSGVWFAGAHLPACVNGDASAHAYTRETIKKYFYGV